ncbi:MAG: biopolymer transporter ExbD [Leptolyngbyaceae cyanobacterium]|uniref:ExbD/TolR family protein n=1 Tax=Leptodesmis TaxID=2664261 RepID=UPI001F2AD3F0|nr:biopolymer transporter ExbD [Leptodesmis sichuanensis]UIE37690.1 biopolymer transporter ExbD [Leptodesmis sichuanensis A121]
MRLPEEPDLPFQINIVPMIDVIFAILTFFIMSSLFLTRSTGLPVNLPKATTAQDQRSSKVTVTVDATGNLRLNQQPIQLNDLQSRVRALSGNGSQLVIINADQQVSHGQVVAVMDQLRQIPGVKLAIATK